MLKISSTNKFKSCTGIRRVPQNSSKVTGVQAENNKTWTEQMNANAIRNMHAKMHDQCMNEWLMHEQTTAFCEADQGLLRTVGTQPTLLMIWRSSLIYCGYLVQNFLEKEDWNICVGYFCTKLPQLGQFLEWPLQKWFLRYLLTSEESWDDCFTGPFEKNAPVWVLQMVSY